MSDNSLGSLPPSLQKVLARWLNDEHTVFDKDTVFYIVARDRDIWSTSEPCSLKPPEEMPKGPLRLEAQIQIVPEDRDIWSGTVHVPVEQTPAPKGEHGSTLRLLPGD